MGVAPGHMGKSGVRKRSTKFKGTRYDDAVLCVGLITVFFF